MPSCTGSSCIVLLDPYAQAVKYYVDQYGNPLAKQVTDVELYVVDGTPIGARGYGSVRKQGATTGVKVSRVALGWDGGATITANDTDALDGGACCATSRTEWWPLRATDPGYGRKIRASSNIAFRINGALLAGYDLTLASQREYEQWCC